MHQKMDLLQTIFYCLHLINIISCHKLKSENNLVNTTTTSIKVNKKTSLEIVITRINLKLHKFFLILK